MANVNLAKALKMKNALVGEINRAREILTRENSRDVESTSKVDRSAIYSDIVAKTVQLTSLKTAIATANVGLYATLSEMAEAKAMIVYLKTLNTLNGIVRGEPSRFGTSVGVDKTFSAFFTQEGVDAEVAKLQKRVEDLQDVADTFNATTTIAV